MVIKGVSRILLLTAVVAMLLSITGCASAVEEADVVGTYVKDDAQAVVFRAGSTAIKMEGSEGQATLQLKAGGEAQLGNATLPWTLDEGKVTIYLFNASTSGDVKGKKIVGLGGEGMTWTKQ